MSLTRTSGRWRSNAASPSLADPAVATSAPASCRIMLNSSRVSASSSTTSSFTPRSGVSRVRAAPSPGRGAAAATVPVSFRVWSSTVKGALQADPDTTARRTELDGIREEVPGDLLQPIRIGEERTCIRIEEGIQLDLLRVRDALHGLDSRLDDRDRIDLPGFDPELAGHDARDVEEVLDELSEKLRVALDHLESPGGADRV